MKRVPVKVLFPLAELATLLTFCANCGGGRVTLEYDHSPGAVIVEYRFGGGLSPVWDDDFPLFRLYGDGRVLSRRDPGWKSMVSEARLSEGDMARLLGEIRKTGFFGLKDEYVNREVLDAPGSSLTVRLDGKEKNVYVYMKDVAEYRKVVDLLRDFPLGRQSTYVPEKGYLVVTASGRGGVLPLPAGVAGEILNAIAASGRLNEAAESGNPVEIKGSEFIVLKGAEVGRERPGLAVEVAGSVYEVYPVYHSRWRKH